VAPLGPGESAFYHNIAAQQPVLYDVDLEAAGQVPEFVVTPFSTSTKYFEAAGRAWLVIFNYEAGVLGQRAELIEVTDGPEAAFEYGNTGSLGAAENFQANGDVDFRINEDGTVSLFVLATNNGIGSYRTVETIAVSAETPRDIMYTAGFESVFPNPFEQEALVSFRVQEAGHVLLEVYDLLGRRVRTLVDGHRAAGVHAASLEAGDLAGGLYVLRLQNGDRTAARAVTLAR
ncbi:MAG: T9SS type A sorting domain-containing protein, partial [Bacteroidota bacterium]